MSGKDSDRDTNKDAVMERCAEHEAEGQNGHKKEDSGYFITVRHYRNRLIDYDNLCTKYATDAIVHTGLLADDNPKIIKGYKHLQIKSKEEKTVYIIERCGDE